MALLEVLGAWGVKVVGVAAAEAMVTVVARAAADSAAAARAEAKVVMARRTGYGIVRHVLCARTRS